MQHIRLQLPGQVVGADTRSQSVEDLLGAVLVRTGRLTEVQLQRALRIQKNTLQRLGHILVKEGMISSDDLIDALLQAGEDRFRPIILTSLTTFIGLLPIMAETSVQAQFLIPMVTSLAFGVLFATGVTLVLVPSLYLLGEQVIALVLRRGVDKATTAAEPSGASPVVESVTL